MFRHDDDINCFTDEGSITYKRPTEINENYVRVTKISRELIKELNAYLKSTWDERGEYAPTADVTLRDGADVIYFDITWGDWKHDHLRLYHLVNQFFRDRGYYVERETEVTETDGSDSYSAEHYFTPYGDDEDDSIKGMQEGFLDDIKDSKIKEVEPKALAACSAMGGLVSSLTDDNKEAWEAQISKEDIEKMKYASDAAYYLYHYRKDGKVRPIRR